MNLAAAILLSPDSAPTRFDRFGRIGVVLPSHDAPATSKVKELPSRAPVTVNSGTKDGGNNPLNCLSTVATTAFEPGRYVQSENVRVRIVQSTETLVLMECSE
jgi:hypothetical protein